MSVKGLRTSCTLWSGTLALTITDRIFTEGDIYRSRSIKPTSSSGRCWRRRGLRKRGEGSTRGLGIQSQRQRRKRWSYASRSSDAAPRHVGLSPFLALPTLVLTSCPTSAFMSRQSALPLACTRRGRWSVWFSACPGGRCAPLVLVRYAYNQRIKDPGNGDCYREKSEYGTADLGLLRWVDYIKINSIDATAASRRPWRLGLNVGVVG